MEKVKQIDINAIKWHKKDILGRGGFGYVYKAKYHDIECAIKFIEADGKYSEKELQILWEYRFQYILQIYGYCSFHKEGTKYIGILMELAERDLESEIKKGKYNLLKLLKQVCKAMDFLHSQNPPIAHRDLKPQNILVVRGEARIADFGLARELDSNSNLTMCGTAGYRAPEVRSENYNVKVDVYSFGMILKSIEQYRDITQKVKRLAEKCCARNHSERPSFKQILAELDSMRESVDMPVTQSSSEEVSGEQSSSNSNVESSEGEEESSESEEEVILKPNLRRLKIDESPGKNRNFQKQLAKPAVFNRVKWCKKANCPLGSCKVYGPYDGRYKYRWSCCQSQAKEPTHHSYSLENDYQLEYISEASTFLWLTYLEYVKQHKLVEDWEETADRFLPAVHHYCSILDKNQLNQRVLGKLLRIAHYLDYSDEAERRKQLKCLKSLLALPNSKKVLHEMIILVQHLFIDDEGESIQHFTATKQMFETHRQLMTKGLTSQDDKLRYLAFKCWALSCVSLEPLAEQSSTKLFLLALAREKNEKIQRIIFQALFDCILLFELSTSDQQIFKALCEHFVSRVVNTYSMKTRKLLTLGFCKCYASGRYRDSLVLGQLMLKCSSDIFEPEKSIRDLIGRFFECFANDEISSIFDDAFKRVVVTLLLSKTTIEPLLIFYKRIVAESMRLQQMSVFLVQQLAKFTSTSLAKNMLDHIEDWIASVSNSVKDEIIFNSTTILDKIQNEQVKHKLSEFIASISSSGSTTMKRKRKLISEQVDQWDQLSLSIASSSSGLPNKKPKIQSNHVNIS